MTKRIFKSICLVAISVFLASLALIMGVLYNYFSIMQQNQLKIQTELAAQGVTNEGIKYFDGLETNNYRITWIDSDGNVLFDTQSNSTDMENHLDREEVRQAFETGYGESSRYSSTLTQQLLYCAKKLPDNTVIRLSGAQYTVITLIVGMFQPILIVALIAVILSLFLAFRLSKSIVKPLNELNLDEPLSNQGYEELSPILNRIKSQQTQLKRQAIELKQKQDEFEAATQNMNEGLILLNDQGIILSINKTASKLLSISSYCIGKDILMLNNSLELQHLLSKAKSGDHAQTLIQLGDLEYQINASPINSNDKISGIVLFIFDITEKEKAEQMRKEFTANVSHELKTPLQSISGYAELLKNSMVQQQDIEKFADQIYTQSQRMIFLVDDIIKLSHLDEGADDMQWENTDIYELAEKTIDSLSAQAQKAKVTLTLNGVHASIYAIPQLVGGIIYNLCDNAIKYNRENGSVSVSIKKDKEAVTLSVSDTGIGIAKEHQDRIFERFYRVDKSHSKEIGGTGLGLSIVKHSAKLHNATIDVNSVINGGTTISVKFPVYFNN